MMPARASEYEFEAELEQAAERMDVGDVVQQVRDAWTALPPDLKQAIVQRGLFLWQITGRPALARFVTFAKGLVLGNPAGWRQALNQNPGQATTQLALQAGQSAGLPPKQQTPPPGMSATQVRQFHRRQLRRGIVPGRNRQIRRLRELEFEIDTAARELEFEQGETFYTKVTPIPGIGSKEGHEILTRAAMTGLPLSAAERSSVELGVIRPDRGGRSYWNFPASAIGSLAASAQPSHSLRPTPASTVAAALSLIRSRFVTLYRNAMTAPNRTSALEWLGEALHLLQDSFSSAHVERAGGTGAIRYIRAFFIRLGWPPRSTAPTEHNAPSDPRDDVFVGGALRPEAHAAVLASRAYLDMALRHLSAPGSPSNSSELLAFLGRYLS
jgi:hypothetical protein